MAVTGRCTHGLDIAVYANSAAVALDIALNHAWPVHKAAAEIFLRQHAGKLHSLLVLAMWGPKLWSMLDLQQRQLHRRTRIIHTVVGAALDRAVQIPALRWNRDRHTSCWQVAAIAGILHSSQQANSVLVATGCLRQCHEVQCNPKLRQHMFVPETGMCATELRVL